MKLSHNPDPLKEEHGNAVIGALQHTPEIASALGTYLAMASQYEMMLLALYRFAAGTGGEFIAVTFGRILAIRTRLEIIEDLLTTRHSEIDSDQYKKALELVKKANIINSRRNNLVHGTYRVYPKTGLVVLVPWALSSRAKSKGGEHLDSKRLAQDTSDITDFCRDVLALCGVETNPD